MPGSRWSSEDDELLRQGTDDPGAVAAKLGRSRAAIYNRMGVLGIASTGGWSDEEIARFKEVYAQMDRGSILEEFGRSKTTIYLMAKKLGLKLPSRATLKNRAVEIVTVEGEPACRIPLTQGFSALIDEEDRELITKRSWSVLKSPHPGLFYTHAFAWREDGTKTTVNMHGEILGVIPGTDIDHKNGDGLDNRRKNLRRCPHQHNTRNMRPHKGCSSMFKGVSWFKAGSLWRAYIVVDARQKHLGYFADEIEAARTYDAAAKELFGEFARINFPEDKVAS